VCQPTVDSYSDSSYQYSYLIENGLLLKGHIYIIISAYSYMFIKVSNKHLNTKANYWANFIWCNSLQLQYTTLTLFWLLLYSTLHANSDVMQQCSTIDSCVKQWSKCQNKSQKHVHCTITVPKGKSFLWNIF